jgi:D-serine deaminase-like pyridoxal phosphate-dependent protein
VPCTFRDPAWGGKQDLPTPCLLVDEEVVAKNCRDMLAKAAAAGVSLRPHVKTHKCHQVCGCVIIILSASARGGSEGRGGDKPRATP